MKKVRLPLFYLVVVILLFLTACGPKDNTAQPAPDLADQADAGEANAEDQGDAADPENGAEESSQTAEANVGHLLQAGTTMKWHDGGFLVYVPGGEVLLGDEEVEDNPEHQVALDGFWIYTFKVTTGQYRQCLAAGACSEPASEPPYPDISDPEHKDRPVIGVTWEQAENYCEWMKGELPTEAQWELAARGLESKSYPWGEEEPACGMLNYGECDLEDLSLVYEYPEGKSDYEAYDLAGNAFEWVHDWYDEDYPSQAPAYNPDGPEDGEVRSIRGSSYKSGEELIPSANRFYLEPEKYRTDLGFRCVVSDPGSQGFANACVQIAYAEGLTAPWQPGGTPEFPAIEVPPCEPPPADFQITQYCPDQSQQIGGLDLLVGPYSHMNWWDSTEGAYCEEKDENTYGCFGPEGAGVEFEICGYCDNSHVWVELEYGCDSGYTLSLDGGGPDGHYGLCTYDGSGPGPGETCPANYVYDPDQDLCLKVGSDSQDCPAGYVYDPESNCCTAAYSDPAPEGESPPDSYDACPLAYGNIYQFWDPVAQQGKDLAVCVYVVESHAGVEACEVIKAELGECEELVCKNPGSYTAKDACEAANCKWIQSGFVPEKCVKP